MEKNQNPNSLNSQSTPTGASLSQPASPNSSPNPETLATESNPDPPSVDPAVRSNGSPEDPKPATGSEEEEEEEEAECGFCLFMKGGGCKDPFVEWEKCVEDAERFGEDIAEKCFEITHNLKICMEAHSDYYDPLLRAEKSMMEEAEAEAEKNHETAGGVQVVVAESESESETKSSKKGEAEDVAAVVVEKPAQSAGSDAES